MAQVGLVQSVEGPAEQGWGSLVKEGILPVDASCGPGTGVPALPDCLPHGWARPVPPAP